MVDDRLLTEVERRLDELGLVLRVAPATAEPSGADMAVVDVTRNAAGRTYRVVTGPDMSLGKVTRLKSVSHPDLPLLVATDYLTEKRAAPLREAGVAFVDTAGNAYLAFDDVLVDVRGRRRPETDAVTLEPERSSNLFSPRRAQVVLAILAWPELAHANIREVAASSGVSVGLAHDAVSLMAESGYLMDEPAPGHRRRELLDFWAAAYPTGLGPRLRLASFRGEPVVDTIRNLKTPIFVSGESAATSLLRPSTLTLYVESLDPRLAVANRWRADRDPNIFVRRKFWTSPTTQDGPSPGVATAPWPLVYADLLASGEPRQQEAAREWRDHHGRPGPW